MKFQIYQYTKHCILSMDLSLLKPFDQDFSSRYLVVHKMDFNKKDFTTVGMAVDYKECNHTLQRVRNYELSSHSMI